ncbi:hypothetical protein AVEN_106623-1 [Araneus ventricosus]|uniref:Uncharacterized protein n=1 Tax=Araneus ventricosus TaxID=182803 RepID=A0A4Y2I5R6_ARAVE|nr:hypothetical protein AVEN_106623-1 [Araneus ventricosus]
MVLCSSTCMPICGRASVGIFAHTSGRTFGPLRMIQRVMGRTFSGIGFEPGALRLRSRDSTTTPPRPLSQKQCISNVLHRFD